LESFADQLYEAVLDRRTPIMVGLDPRYDLLPGQLRPMGSEAGFSVRAAACGEFCRGVIDVVAPLVPIVKPQAAFFEELGPPGMVALKQTIQYAQAKGLLVVVDGKRGDIGSTATAYAAGYLGRGDQSAWGADALTVHPYLGDDSLKPFVDLAVERSAGIFVLVKTSNPGGRVFQDLKTDGRTVYEHVAALVETLARQTQGKCAYGAVGAVVGATYPEQLAELRRQMPHTWLLVPGYGSQGGTAKQVASAFDARGFGAVINNSRGILFAYRQAEYATTFGEARWQAAVEAATRRMIEEIRTETPAGRLGTGSDSR
jgi:orotidine-5'-phosphate decarboxylase